MKEQSARYRFAERSLGATNAEIASEKAASLGRAGRRLEDALRDLAESERTGDTADRSEALERAAEALYFYVVQREACGLRDDGEVFRAFGVPRDVQLRMGTSGRSRRAGGG